MDRRKFLSRLGVGSTAVAVTSAIPSAKQEPLKLEDGSLRPRCPVCQAKMLVRYDGPKGFYAFCGITDCTEYGKNIWLAEKRN